MMPSPRAALFFKCLILSTACVLGLSGGVGATQLHAHSEGIIVHQIGHLFFLLSMVVLIFFITGKGLDRQKGWRRIQISAFLFILWNFDALAAHFLDNQLNIIQIEPLSFFKMALVSKTDSIFVSTLYYLLKLDHLLCVPAMLFLYLGLSGPLSSEKRLSESRLRDDP